MAKDSVKAHFDKIAPKYDSYTKKRDLHYSTLKNLLKSLIPEGKSVFDFGCGTGDILASLNPKTGYGMDISSHMIKIANKKYSYKKNVKFSNKWPRGFFDYIVMCDVIEHLENPGGVFKKISKLMNKKTVFICTMMNPLWEPLEVIYTFLGLKMPEGKHKRIVYAEIKKILLESGLSVQKHDYKLLMPVRIPFITNFLNTYVEKYLKKFAFIEYFTATKE